MNPPKYRLLDMLRARSFKRGEVTLASGKKSNFFIDCKRTILVPEGLALVGHVVLDAIGDALEERVGEGVLDAVAAVPLGGCPIADSAALLAYQRGESMGVLYVRKERKDHGTRCEVEGSQSVPHGAKVVLVEDVVTSGGSSLRAVEALKRAGYELLFVVTLVDRLEGGRERLAGAGVDCRAVFTRRDFIDHLA